MGRGWTQFDEIIKSIKEAILIIDLIIFPCEKIHWKESIEKSLKTLMRDDSIHQRLNEDKTHILVIHFALKGFDQI
jgi:hypothetical protein